MAGHIPGAVSMPLFSDEERAVVGTLYKQEGHVPAMEAGLDFVGPKMAGFVRRAREAVGVGGALGVYCWRGGMRSGSVSWLLSQAGFTVNTLAGGYKAYRQHVRTELERPWPLLLLGGTTGCGKTEILHQMAAAGAQVIDLEALAHHKGSDFGGIGQGEQPRIEMFENVLVGELSRFDPSKPIWMEDESQSIGKVFIYKGFFEQMRTAPMVVVEVDLDVRIARLVRVYAGLPKVDLEAALVRIRKRMGGQMAKDALACLAADDFEGVGRLALAYYDKNYRPTGRVLATIDQKGSDLAAIVCQLMAFGVTFSTLGQTKTHL